VQKKHTKLLMEFYKGLERNWDISIEFLVVK